MEISRATTGPTTMPISSISGDVNALAVRLTNLRSGVGAEAAGAVAPRASASKAAEGGASSAGRGAAVVMDERTARLAAAVAEASAAGGSATASSSQPLSDARREMIAASAQSLEGWHRNVRDFAETIELYEKTGRVVQIQTTFSEGNQRTTSEMTEKGLEPWGGAEGFITMLRERRERIISEHIPEAERILAELSSGN